jgi:glyoxylase-like metal-dependent hydrolase (beta-lactamase superfamily II)/rhodanese-related sulfurtransferase
MATIVPIDTPTLGDRSYLAHDGRVAIVIDPQRDIDRVLQIAAEANVSITHVFETHIHNDYVTGGYALADRTGAKYYLNEADDVTFAREQIADGDVVAVSPSLQVTAISTPGHTHTHLAYVLAFDGRPVGVFTGGSLLFGSTGRPDLLGTEHTDVLAHAQFHSARRLARELPDDAEVFPTHGFGSFCSATQSEGESSTIGREKLVNPALTNDEQRYVDELLAGLDAYPAYYAHMAAANAAGPSEPDLLPPSMADARELRRRIDSGEWVVDLRSRTAFAAGHIAGTFNFGLDGSFATYLGWVIPWGTPVTLLGDSAEQVAQAQRELIRIGIERPVAAATGRPDRWAVDGSLSTFDTARFRELAITLRLRPHGVVVLDVRRRLEWRDSHIAGAVHIPFHELPSRLDDLPDGEIWVHCEAGYRASIAASFLAAAGRSVVAVDDDFSNAHAAGIDLITNQEDIAWA